VVKSNDALEWSKNEWSKNEVRGELGARKARPLTARERWSAGWWAKKAQAKGSRSHSGETGPVVRRRSAGVAR
jgi:hypothetical protein